VVAGKGGVGKTTVTAVLTRAAALEGRRVLAVELDGKPTLGNLLGDDMVRSISAADALDEYLRDHGFVRVAKRLNRTGVIDMVGTAAPGIDDVVVLGKIKQLERSGDFDLIVVGSRAYGPLRRTMLGSTSRRLFNGSSCAVLAVPRGSEPLAETDEPSAAARRRDNARERV
jgi:cellulose biosynthesis protein BcsQ